MQGLRMTDVFVACFLLFLGFYFFRSLGLCIPLSL